MHNTIFSALVTGGVAVGLQQSVLASAAATSNIAYTEIDLTANVETFTHNWEECVGSGHMLLGTRSDWQSHLKLAHEECGFKRIRGHGLLDDDMSFVAGMYVHLVVIS